MEGIHTTELVTTGIAGLDDILRGGFTAGRMHLISGRPGTGKTTFALHFIAAGIRSGERTLYITVGGGERELFDLAQTSGIFLDPGLFGIYRVEISREILEGPEQRIFRSAETEVAGAFKDLLAEIKRVKPQRLVIDSLSDLRLLAEDLIGFRRLVLGLRLELDALDCTVLLVTNVNVERSDMDMHLETICHGVIYLEQLVLGFGPIRRRLLVVKFRGRAYRSGWHDFRIETGAIQVFPTLIASEHWQQREKGQILSGKPELDSMFGGGLDRGSTTAIIGSSGTGKTTVATHFAAAASKKGEYAVIYLFDETVEAFRDRAEGLGMGIEELVQKGMIGLHHPDVAEFSVGEFTAMLRQDVTERNARLVVIDTLSGYANAMTDEEYITVQLHELLVFLSHHGVATILAVEQHGVYGSPSVEPRNVSYLADSILLLRFFESRGEIKRAMSVIKRRRGPHETAIREFTMTKEGIAIGEPLVDLHGILTGVPVLDV